MTAEWGRAMLTRTIRAAFALTVVIASPALAQTKPDMPLVDLTDDFARIWDQTAQLPDAERPTAFKAAFAKIFPGFYDEKRFDAPAAKYDERLLRRLKEYPAKREGIQRVAANFAQLFAPARKSFEAEFGSMAGYPPIYLVNSLGEFDGGTRALPEGYRLMFGADVIDALYRTTPIPPFFHHELFHIVHHSTFPDCEPLWCSLWGEGLAVYVASRLNPGADDASLLLTFPVPLRPAVEGHKQEAICAVRARLYSTDSKDYAPLFNGGVTPLSANLPPRFGYYIGYRVAEDIGKGRSLKELAALSQAEVKPLIEKSLAKMADCPAPAESKPIERG
jgi:hypothetical protein